MCREHTNDGFFVVTHVHRDDLEGAGFDVSDVDDDTMQEVACRLSEAYCDNGFWIDLPIIAEYLGIPAVSKGTQK